MTNEQSIAPIWVGADYTVKRVFDILLSVLGSVFAMPLLLVLALLVKLDSPGPAFFVDARLGRYGVPFKCFKFRTMHVNGDAVLAAYLAKNPDAQTEWSTYKKLRSYDPRVTKVGKWLRALSLDELPQLFNVLLGQMSLVGPRPYLPREREEMGVAGNIILSVPPGITGLWQVSGRNELSFRQRIRLEAWYARHRSLWFDVVLLFRTVRVVLSKRGAS